MNYGTAVWTSGEGAYASTTGSDGVFMVPVSGPPAGVAGNLNAVNAPIEAAAVGLPDSSVERGKNPYPRRDLTRISRSLQRGNIGQAEKELRKLIIQKPSDARAHYVCAYVYFLDEKYVAASFVLRRALMLDATMGASGRTLLADFYDADRSAGVLAKLDEHIDEHPDDAEARLVRAYVLFLEGRPEAARADLDVLLKRNKSDQQATDFMKLCAVEVSR